MHATIIIVWVRSMKCMPDPSISDNITVSVEIEILALNCLRRSLKQQHEMHALSSEMV